MGTVNKRCKCANQRLCRHNYQLYYSVKGTQVRESSKTTDRRLALSILHKVETEIIEGKYFAKHGKYLFPELVEQFKANHVVKLRSAKCYGVYLRNLDAYFHNYQIGDITPQDILAYKKLRLSTGITPATINRDLACLSGMFSFAIRVLDWVNFNPLSKIEREIEDNERDRWVSETEEQTLLNACTKEYLKDIIKFDIDTGLRLNELLTLTWPQINWEYKFITVTTYKTGARKGKAKLRSIPLTLRSLEILEKRKGTIHESGRVFLNDKKELPINFRNDWDSTLKRSGLLNLRFHDLRHTFATRLVQKGVDLYIVMRLLGHSNLLTTQRYSHHSPASLRPAIELLDKTFLSSLGTLTITGIEKEDIT